MVFNVLYRFLYILGRAEGPFLGTFCQFNRDHLSSQVYFGRTYGGFLESKVFSYLIPENFLHIIGNEQTIVHVKYDIIPVLGPVSFDGLLHPYFRVTLARYKYKEDYATPYMNPKVTTCHISPIQSSADKGYLSHVFNSKLGSADYKFFLKGWRL